MDGPGLIEWAGGTRGTFAIVFTDIVGSTALRGTLKDERMSELLHTHFGRSDELIAQHGGWRVKTIGDGVLALFRTAGSALDFARAIQENPGPKNLRMRAGIHVGEIHIEPSDVAGIEVHIAARVVDKIIGPEIWLTDRAKVDVDGLGARKHDALKWQRHPKVIFKGLKNTAFILWSLGETSARGARSFSNSSEGSSASTRNKRELTPYGTAVSRVNIESRPAIAVLPFINLSNTPGHSHLSDGITDDIINELASCRMFPVIARNSSFAFKDQMVEVTEVGRRLGARYVMEGSFNRRMQRIRISARLIDAVTGIQMAAERFDRDFNSFSEIQDQITEMIVGSLAPELLRVERQRIVKTPEKNPTSYEYFLRGQEFHYRYTKTDNSMAQKYLERAIESDPLYSQAHALLAHAIIHAVQLGWRDDDQHNYAIADQHATRSMALDPRAPFAHFALGATSMFLGRIDQALYEMRETVKINPSHAAAHAILAHLLCYVDQPEEALKSVEWAIRLSPYDPRLGLWLAGKSQAHYFKRNYFEAVAAGQQALLLLAENPIAQRFTLASLGQMERMRDSQPLIHIIRRSPTPSLAAIKQSVLRLYRNPLMVEHMLDGLRKAGLPEN
jgi:adenylate cyclase